MSTRRLHQFFVAPLKKFRPHIYVLYFHSKKSQIFLWPLIVLFGGVKVVKVALANGVVTHNADAAGARQLTQAVIGWGRQGRRPR